MFYIQNHWQGNFSIAKSFWMNLIGINFLCNLVGVGLLSIPLFQQNLLYFLLNFQLFKLPVCVWQCVGLYRSYQKNYRLTKYPVWSSLAVAFGFISLFSHIEMLITQLSGNSF